MNRRTALLAGGAMLAHLRAPCMAAEVGGSTAARRVQAAPLDADVVRGFVRAAHADLAAVRAALEAQPRLANACWDWGAGDFETALGAASHMGRRDIAEVLLAHGARADLFTLIVVRDVDLLRAQFVRHPALVLTKGPHGLTFEAHARATGDRDVELAVQDIVAEARAALK